MMLLVDKHTDPALSIINISSIIIEIILENGIITYDDLLNLLVSRTSKKAKNVFLYSLSFLYSIKKIEYLQDNDCFRLVI